MFKTILLLFLIVSMGGTSAWIGQRWRMEGNVQEAKAVADGAVMFEKLTAGAESEAKIIFAEKERDGQNEGAVIVATAKIAGRTLALEGDELRTRVENSGELATVAYYLEPVFGADKAIAELSQRLERIRDPEEREN